MKAYFDILGVDVNASTSEIKKAYKKRALELHPDKGGNNADMVRLNEAYHFLLNPSQRANAAASFQPEDKSNLTYIVVINSDGRFRPQPFKSSIENLKSLFSGERGLSNTHFYDSRLGIQNLHSLWAKEWSLNYYDRGGFFRGIPYMMLEFHMPRTELMSLYQRIFTEKTATKKDLELFRQSFDSAWIYDNPDYEQSYYEDSLDNFLYKAKLEESAYAKMNSLLHFGLAELVNDYEIFPRVDPRISALSAAYRQTLDRVTLNVLEKPKGIAEKDNPLVIDVIRHVNQAHNHGISSLDELTRLDSYLERQEREHTTFGSFFKKSPELIYILFIREPLKNEIKKNQKYLANSENQFLPTVIDEKDNEENNENYLKLLAYE